MENLFAKSIAMIDKVAGTEWDRDLIHTEGITKALFECIRSENRHV